MGIPTYSGGALAARDVFHVGSAAVFVYVEDEDQENLYYEIFRRCASKLKSFKIFPLGGKENVLRHARGAHGALGGTVRTYLVDKDFDDLLGLIEQRPGLVYLDDYCIENVVIDEAALLQIAIEERPKTKRDVLKRRISFDRTLKAWMPELDRLHRAFLLVQKYDLGIPNCDQAPEVFSVDGAPARISKTKIDSYLTEVRGRLMEKGVIKANAEFVELLRVAFKSGRLNVRNVSGKFLLRLWYHHLKQADCIGNVRAESLTIRLAGRSRLRRLRPPVKRMCEFVSAALA